MPDHSVLTVHQRLATSGARAVEIFRTGGALRLAVPQLAEDIPGAPAHMNGGNSDVGTRLYIWRAGKFEDDGTLPVPGGEDAEFFTIGGEGYLALASLRSGQGPYDLNCASPIYRWSENGPVPFQTMPTFGAKQWRFFECDGRRFLALAQGVTMEGVEARHPATSRIYEWDGARFAEFQVLDGRWGYNWTFFELGALRLLAYADHAGASCLLRWDGKRFVPFQEIGEKAGRAFAYFTDGGESWLVYAPIFGETTLQRWDGERFVVAQSLGGDGGRELKFIETARGRFLVRVCFIQGTPHDPKPQLQSQIYRWQDGAFAAIEEFATTGGTDAAYFEADGEHFLAVSNSLSPEVRYQADTIVYRCGL
jgi:EPTP domain